MLADPSVTELVKRTIVRDPETGSWTLWRPTSADAMVAFTEGGGGRAWPEAERAYQITILEVFRHIASVKCVSPEYVDYLQLARFGDRTWRIVNVLWEMRQGDYEPDA